MDKNVPVPRDLTRVKSKILFNLTARQLICFGLAAVIGIPLYFMVKKAANPSTASLVMILIMLPFFFLGMYEKDGKPLEAYLKVIWDYFQKPKIRKYRYKKKGKQNHG